VGHKGLEIVSLERKTKVSFQDLGSIPNKSTKTGADWHTRTVGRRWHWILLWFTQPPFARRRKAQAGLQNLPAKSIT